MNEPAHEITAISHVPPLGEYPMLRATAPPRANNPQHSLPKYNQGLASLPPCAAQCEAQSSRVKTKKDAPPGTSFSKELSKTYLLRYMLLSLYSCLK